MKTRMRTSLIVALRLVFGLAVLGGIVPETGAQCNYEITAVIQGPLCADGSPAPFLPTALDEQGNAVGRSFCFITDHASLWTGSGLAQYLPDSGESQALAILDPDHVVGVDVQAGASLGVAALWESGNLIMLGTLPGDDFSEARGINQSMQIIGLSSGSSSGGSFLWENGEMSALGGFPIGTVGIVNDINDNGQIVGYMGGSIFTSNAFLWENGIITDLGKIPGGNSANAVAINNISHVTGSGAIPMEGTIFGVPHAFFWDGQTMIDIGTLPDHLNSGASDINDLDEIVGESSNVGGNINISHAIYWRDGVLYDLNDLVIPDLGGGCSGHWQSTTRERFLLKLAESGYCSPRSDQPPATSTTTAW